MHIIRLIIWIIHPDLCILDALVRFIDRFWIIIRVNFSLLSLIGFFLRKVLFENFLSVQNWLALITFILLVIISLR